jgi:hypothetical protein
MIFSPFFLLAARAAFDAAATTQPPSDIYLFTYGDKFIAYYENDRHK